MRNSQRLLMEMSAVRERINTLPDDSTDEVRNAATTEYMGLESRYRAAMVLEDAEDAQPLDNQNPERREIRRLFDQSYIADYLLEAADHVALTGAAKEFREAVLGADSFGFMPLELLAERVEDRADAVSNVATAIQENQMNIAPRVFARGALGYLGVATPTVPIGTVTYPRLSAGTTADVRVDGAELDGTVAALMLEQINPVRLTASYTFGLETLQRIRGYEEALRSDIQSVLQDKRDALGINGQAAVDNMSPAVVGIISSLTNPSNPTAEATFAEYLAAYDAAVDGVYALNAEEVRMLVNAETWRHAMGLRIGSAGASDLFRMHLPAGRFRVSANMPDTPDSGGMDKIATALTYAAGAGAEARGYFMPTWAGVQMIVDPYTGAKVGQRRLTALMMVGFDMVDGAAYKRAEFQVQA